MSVNEGVNLDMIFEALVMAQPMKVLTKTHTIDDVVRIRSRVIRHLNDRASSKFDAGKGAVATEYFCRCDDYYVSWIAALLPMSEEVSTVLHSHHWAPDDQACVNTLQQFFRRLEGIKNQFLADYASTHQLTTMEHELMKPIDRYIAAVQFLISPIVSTDSMEF
jgi:hypothetical protein